MRIGIRCNKYLVLGGKIKDKRVPLQLKRHVYRMAVRLTMLQSWMLGNEETRSGSTSCRDAFAQRHV